MNRKILLAFTTVLSMALTATSHASAQADLRTGKEIGPLAVSAEMDQFYYVWYRFPGQHWHVAGPYSLRDAYFVAGLYSRNGAAVDISTHR